ncbi:IS1634 family transposase, partial [Muribaculum intestinale]|uniref:IS1634 family transposase n=1 Tax=Muribaculum intestinale TaxID=1796646 RepID=UPI003F662D43
LQSSREAFRMYISLTGNSDNKDVYIKRSYRKSNGKTATQIHRKLGKLNELLVQFSGDYDAMMAWAKSEAEKDTMEYNAKAGNVTVSFSRSAYIPKNEERCFQIGYLFLQKLCTELKLDSICQKISKRHKYTYDFGAILTDQIFSRFLAPSSKLSSYSYCRTLLEPPKYELQNIYRALSVMAEESDFIQEELYCNSNFVHPRSQKVLYYDCTNYYFEIEQDDDFRKYGKSKENRPNPIVTMGLFMDADGIPLAFDVFPGNQNEQATLKPLETKIIRDFACSEFVFCSDAGLGSKSNRRFNSFGNRSYVITQSLKKMRGEDRQTALNPKQFRRLGSDKFIDISTLDESDSDIYETIFYKEVPVVNGNMDETVIVTYSPKYRAYQKRIRDQQISRAIKMIEQPGKKRKGKNQNDPARFIKTTNVTNDGEIAGKKVCELDLDKIRDEEKYDGFYAVITNLEDDICGILKINRQRWEIEENFRIMKTDFEARPVYVRREDRIKAHFLTCYISLLVYRLLEKRIGNNYTCNEILSTLRSMQVTLLSKESGYIPSYK